ncbi:helix-turn-helix transcriptional regulator [Thalassobius sp. Cn5-15]|uniref:helix-turn-helix domain-containing protein n=1 Tax=Thalassobius sp. Cn5-15 TaxID=2917763 RepID=UPI001EF37D7F|nr:helix-turn-helix transcriptional regulator [Thalassobius sp. Cn5-15]MCG7492344.1 helix-turn-helix domain-containing protein [Thalassobius sp. Cn5-15]
MTIKKQCFSANLSLCCAAHRSVSQVCRDIGINRPQFVRYLKGEALPSANNLGKIAAFFRVTEAELFLPPDQFRTLLAARHKARRRDPRDMIFEAFRSDQRRTDQFQGFYHSHYISPSWGYSVVRGLMGVWLDGGVLQTRGILRTPVRNRKRFRKAGYYGLMTAARGHLFVVEKTLNPNGALCETILRAEPQPVSGDLQGKVMAVSSNAAQSVFVSPAVWRPLAAGTGLRAAMKDCGLYALDSPELPADICKYLKTERRLAAR